MPENIHPIFKKLAGRQEKQALLNQKSKVIWLTGLSGSGKSTLALGVEQRLFEEGFLTEVLDGDNIRSGINNNLGFSLEDRYENIRRISEVAKLFLNSGVISIAAFISPTREIRQMAKSIIGEEDFIEVYMSAPLEVCESRDVKGLYKKARKGEIKGFTGIDSPYEPPVDPDLILDTTNENIPDTIERVINYIRPLIKNES
ncbi:MAG: adenylyl-sulfate kinase [Bacteroidetes bacterium]|nr:MAG: adenylyl-sulfate kinase [Bacteroidota bacterium]